MDLSSRKAKDSDVGQARKTIDQELAYWGQMWRVFSMEELPSHLQSLIQMYQYTLWLEEQLAFLREEQKDDNVRTDSRESSDIDKADDLKSAPTTDDKGGDHLGTVLPEAELCGTVTPPTDGTGGTELRPDDSNVHTRNELGV